MNVFTNLYLDTIHPQTPYSRLLSNDVVLSVIVHTIFYILVIYVICQIFNIKMKDGTYTNIIMLLIIIMILGYLGRLYRSKSIFHYKALESNNSVQSIQDTLDLMHKGYFKYYFLG